MRSYTRPKPRVKPYRVRPVRWHRFGEGLVEETVEDALARIRRENAAEAERLLAAYPACDEEGFMEPDLFEEMQAAWDDQFTGYDLIGSRCELCKLETNPSDLDSGLCPSCLQAAEDATLDQQQRFARAPRGMR